MILHAYRRKEPHQVEVAGQVLKFAANEQDHQVCDAPPGPATDRLLELSEGYVVYGDTKQSEPAPASKYLLVNGEETVDLRTLDRAALVAFSAAQGLDYKPHANSKDDTVRDKIVELLTAG